MTHYIRLGGISIPDIKSCNVPVFRFEPLVMSEIEGGAYCRTGLCFQVYYRHLAHLFDRFNNSEVAISFIRRINYLVLIFVSDSIRRLLRFDVFFSYFSLDFCTIDLLSHFSSSRSSDLSNKLSRSNKTTFIISFCISSRKYLQR